MLQNLFSHALFTLENLNTYVVVTQVNVISIQTHLFCSFSTLDKRQGENININGISCLKYILESHNYMDLDIK